MNLSYNLFCFGIGEIKNIELNEENISSLFGAIVEAQMLLKVSYNLETNAALRGRYESSYYELSKILYGDKHSKSIT